jgi:hypothetical protein
MVRYGCKLATVLSIHFRKMLVSAALSIASLGMKAISGISNAIKMRKEKKRLKSEGATLDEWYASESNQDYMNTEQAQSVMAKLRENLKKNNQVNANTSAVMGGTDEATIASNEATNQAIGDTASAVAGQATEYKNGIRQDYQSQKSVLNQQMSDLNKKSAQSSANAGSNAMQAFGSVVNANKQNAFDGATVGGLFKNLRNPNKGLLGRQSSPLDGATAPDGNLLKYIQK